jgi:hypothetical protein
VRNKRIDMRGNLSAESQSNSAENIMGMLFIKQSKSPKKTFTNMCPVREELFHEDRDKYGRTEDGQTDKQTESQKKQS